MDSVVAFKKRGEMKNKARMDVVGSIYGALFGSEPKGKEVWGQRPGAPSSPQFNRSHYALRRFKKPPVAPPSTRIRRSVHSPLMADGGTSNKPEKSTRREGVNRNKTINRGSIF